MELSYKHNLGNVDGILRVILGVVLLFLVRFDIIQVSIIVGQLFIAVGAFLIIEGIMGY